MRKQFVNYFRDRFGVDPGVWEPFRLSGGSQSIRMLARGVPETLDMDVEMSGFRVARHTSDRFKPTTRGIQWLGNEIQRHRVEMKPSVLRCMLDRVDVESNRIPGSQSLERGYVALYFRGWPVGCGFWTGDTLRTQLPKSLTEIFPREYYGDSGV